MTHNDQQEPSAKDAPANDTPTPKPDAAATGRERRRAIAGALREAESGAPTAKTAAGVDMSPAAFEALRAETAERRRAKLAAQVPLIFHDVDPNAEKAIHEDISAIVPTGDGESLWIGADEGAALERLTARRDREGAILGYGEHVRFDLHEFFDFPNGRDEEADVEGLSVSEGYLWVVGSHSLKRRKPKLSDGLDEALDRLTEVVREANRFLVGRIPLVAGDRPGVLSLARSAPAIDGSKTKRRAGALRMRANHSALSRRLAKDVHLGPFLSIPSKDNGLDVEGVAVAGDRVFLGLRGPVLRGWATVVEIEVKPGPKGALKLKSIGEDGCGYLKHFLDLDGLGIRSLRIDGQDVVLLAGPTMDLDGPVRLYRWRNALATQESSVVPRADVERVLDLPFGEGVDHAEGATMIALKPGGRPALMIAYDTPAQERVLQSDGGGVLADVFEMPDAL